MKKFLIFTLLFLSLFSVTAAKINVCVYPENNEISSYLNNYFEQRIEVKSCSLKISDSDLETGDKQLMHLICDLSKSDYVIMPLKSDLADFHHLTLYGYDNKQEKFIKLHESLAQDSYEFGLDSISKIARFILPEKEFESFKLPPVNDQIGKIEIPNINASDLKPDWMKDKTIYEDARNKFYYSFAGTLALFGVKTASSSLGWKTLECVSSGAICLSLTAMVKNMFDYFRYADYISP